MIRLAILLSSMLLFTPLATAQATRPTRSLAGPWRFEMDRADAGVDARWFARDLVDRIDLPGSLQAQGFGDEISVDTPWVAALPRDMRWHLRPEYAAYTTAGNVKMPYLSQPVRHYLGVAWYQRDVEIPDDWRGRRVVLTLERPRWETTAWVDDRRVGSCHSLVAPHAFDLGTLAPGRHRISVRIDNRMILPYRPDGHSVSDAEGQTWNGVAGAIELSATTPVWIEDAQAFPNVEKRSVRLRVRLGNATGRAGAGTIVANGAPTPVTWTADGGEAELDVPLGADAKPWSEFSPTLHRVALRLTGEGADDARDVVFGLREIRTDGKRILLNGVVLNMRGTHHGGGFPLTGTPATDVESWRRIIRTCKAWGLNAIRFHSWCPPEAAFTAADELGFYLQPECGMWNSFDPDGRMLAVLNDETERLLRAYGNHPSFIILAAGNEPAGRFKAQLPGWNEQWRKRDARRLFTDGSGRPAEPTSRPTKADLVVSADYNLTGRIRGPGGWFGADYESGVATSTVPVITHELGQWCAYPDYDVIRKFTGYLRPSNYEVFRDSAAAHGLLADNKRLAHASGRFQLACYKEEIEANLRTPSLSGFQLLDIRDYLGQGTAPVGVLDAFWESKGYATPEEFRRFCDATVVLARLKGRIFTSAQTLEADVEVAHFGDAPLTAAVPEWRIEDSAGRAIAGGAWAPRDVPIGKNMPLGTVRFDLAPLASPGAYKLFVGLRGTKVENDWNVWVYPPPTAAQPPADVLVTSDWPDAERRLQAGGKVLFQPTPRDLDDADPKLSSTPVFWNFVMNGKGTTFVGMWVDARHPALAGFPSEANCDWQWVDATQGGRSLNLDGLPGELQPIVQPIDEWSRNFRLGLIYEARVGDGRLMVSGVDLAADRPSTAALRRSLLDYMAGDRFAPTVAIAPEAMRDRWASTRTGPRGAATRAVLPQAPEVDVAPDAALPGGPRR